MRVSLRRIWCPALVAALVSVACAPSGPADTAQPRIDAEAARTSLLAADSALSAAAGEQGIAAGLLPRLAPDAFYLQAGQRLVRGADSVRALLTRTPSFGAMRFRWHPIRIDVSADGSLGSTWGYGTTTATGSDGASGTAPAGYAIVWRRAGDGKWQVAAFLRNAARAALTAAPAGFESSAAASSRAFPDADRVRDRAAIERADIEFSAYSRERGLAEAFAAYAAPDGALLQGAFGPDAIRKAMEGGPADMQARWSPAGADVAASGDLGYTVGSAVFNFTDDGKPTATYSKYITVWRRQPNGEWKWVFDGGNASPGPPVDATAAVNGTTLAYDIRGEGPTVVLIHGGGFDRRLWDGQVDTLARHFRVIRYDVRGSGRSGRLGTGPFEHHADLAALLQHLRVDRASIVGQSLGARIAFDFALAHPAMVDRIVAVGPGLSGWPWSASDFGPWLETFRRGLTNRDTALVVEGWLAAGYMASTADRPAVRELVRRHARDNVHAWFEQGEDRELDPPALGRLGEVRAPTLIVLGARDERVIARITDTLVARLPDVRREIIPNTGHAPNLEEPERFNRLVVDFLRSGSGGRR